MYPALASVAPVRAPPIACKRWACVGPSVAPGIQARATVKRARQHGLHAPYVVACMAQQEGGVPDSIKDMGTLDAKSMAVTGEFLVMLHERLEKMEERMDKQETQQLEGEKLQRARYKELLTSIIMSLECRHDICADVFAFLLGVTPYQRRKSHLEFSAVMGVVKALPRSALGDVIVPSRARELYEIQTAQDAAAGIKRVPIWQISPDAISTQPYNIGFNMGLLLRAMTLEELEQYWAYRLAWSQWAVGNK